MKTLAEQDVFDKQFAVRLAMLIESGLIDAHFYEPWTYDVMMALDSYPDWIVELSSVQYSPDAVGIIREFAFSAPVEPLDADNYVDEYLCCFYLRYARGEISWATFLQLSGKLTDTRNGRRDCEAFYCILNDLEAGEFSKAIEQQQRAKFERDYAEAITSVQTLYQGFLEYFRRNVTRH